MIPVLLMNPSEGAKKKMATKKKPRRRNPDMGKLAMGGLGAILGGAAGGGLAYGLQAGTDWKGSTAALAAGGIAVIAGAALAFASAPAGAGLVGAGGALLIAEALRAVVTPSAAKTETAPELGAATVMVPRAQLAALQKRARLNAVNYDLGEVNYDLGAVRSRVY